MAVINVLDKQTAELIAAGEVVERPSSVVKELVENSIDAGAKNIIVDIEHGGIRKILVQDDGCGIDSEYVRTAFIRHATSKISTRNDLENISSLGFRGEALASIASVSDLTLITKTEEQDFAVELKLLGGEEVSFEIKPFVTGSRFIIRDLFYNTPARMKFLKKDSTEAGYIQDILTNLALSKPNIAFKFIKDGKEIFSTIGDGNLLNTISSLFSTQFAKSLVEVNYSDGKYKIEGFTTLPHASRQSRNMQYSFINSRFVKNKTVIAASENAYKGTVMVGKFPGYILNISMPFDLVDVNVHPAKTEVRFANESEVFSAIYKAIKMSITTENTIKQFSFKQQTSFPVEKDVVKQQTFTDEISENQTFEKLDSQSNLFAFNNKIDNNVFEDKENVKKTDNFVNKYIIPQMQENNDNTEIKFESSSSPFYLSKNKRNIDIDDEIVDFQKISTISDITQNLEETDLANKKNIFDNNNITSYNNEKNYIIEEDKPIGNFDFINADDEDVIVVGEIFSTYILCQINDELVVIDKHAAHERLLYENLKKNIKTGKQMLLVPETLKLSATEKYAVMDNIELLEEQGFEIEDFGSNGIIIRAIPMYITSEDPKSLVLEIAYNLGNGNKAEISEKLDWIFHSVACRSAIKAGDKAEINQLKQLVKDIRTKKIPLYCPHGRPVIISISKKELEKQFGR